MDDDQFGDQYPNKNAGENDTLENEEIEFSDDERTLLDEETSKKVDSLFAQKKHWREKAKKFEKEHKETLTELEALKKPKKSEAPEPPKKDKEDELVALKTQNQEFSLRLDNPTLKGEDIKKAVAYAKAEGVENVQEFINSDFFQAYLKNKAEKEAAAKSVPNPSNRSGSGKIDYEKLTPEQIGELSDEEYPKYQKWLKEKEGGNRSGLRIRPSVGMS